MKKAERLIPGKSLLVINGDTFVDVNLKELVKFHRSRNALVTMAVVKVADDLVFHREALAQLRGLLAKYSKEKGNRLPITAFKELAGISRKYAIPLLEHLDREHVTRRAGDERVIL